MTISAFDSAFMRQVREQLGGELASREQTLLNATLSSLEEYKHLTGVRRGILRALEVMDEVEQRMLSAPVNKEKRKTA